MQRFHVNVSVTDLDESIRFYTTLFGTEPVVRKGDYAKWLLEDPRLNFAISKTASAGGISHIGLQADSAAELAVIQERLREAGEATLDQVGAECCYARSDKSWVRDPDNVSWETFVTHGDITHYGDDIAPQMSTQERRCCA